MRQPELDLVKWVALSLVTLGHTRFVWPELGWLAQPGRFAFVSLCAVMAAHALRQGAPCRSTWRQFGYLILAGIASQWPFYELTGRESGNIMLTLTCALGVMTGVRMPGLAGTALAVSSIAVPLLVPLEYGLLGVLLPVSFLLALTSSNRATWAVPIALAGLCQGGWLNLGLAAASALAVLVFLSRSWAVPALPRVGRWAYAYYPAHMAALAWIAH